MLRNSFFALHGYALKNPELTEFYTENLPKYSELVKKGFDEKSFNEIDTRLTDMNLTPPSPLFPREK